MSQRYTLLEISSLPTDRGRSTALTPLTAATAGTVRTRDALSSDLADNSSSNNGGTGGVEPEEFGSLADDDTNSALRVDSLFCVLYSIQDTDPENDYNIDARVLATLTIQTANDAIELADYNNRPKPDAGDEPTIDDNTDSEPEGKDTTITSTTSATVPTTVPSIVSTNASTTVYIFSIAQALARAQAQAIYTPLVLGSFGPNISVSLDKKIVTSSGNVLSKELKLALQYIQTSVSRIDFGSLSKILKTIILESSVVDNLPLTVNTIKKHTKDFIPIPELRKLIVPLTAEQIPLIPAGLKDRGSQYIEEQMYFFNVREIIVRIVTSDLFHSVY